ncbi:hypothetical protein P7L78_12395 [Tistrella bauzanensis]|uniref:hypothetical protein n=1 Tax=Tistrella TaxID=171436 RepID=UPI0031F6F76C
MPNTWRRALIVFTLVWMTFVTAVTGADPAHPLFNGFFLVPLAAWIGAMATHGLIRRRRGDQPVSPDDRRRRP